ncbi:MAG: hypothetical protein AJITA_01047 [Acetilactobacillus jinshanensis]
MLKKSVLYHRKKELHSRFRYLPQVRLKNAFVILDVVLAKLADSIGWYYNQVPKKDAKLKKQILDLYVEGLDHFFLVANLKNWNQVVWISDKELDHLASRKKTKYLSQLYLAIKNMLYDSYFNHNLNDLMYSWKLYLKLGLSDLGLSQSVIAQAFHRKYGQKRLK